MVATFRCNEIKVEALEKTAQPLRQLKMNCYSGVVNGFKQECESIIKDSIDYYNGEAYSYHKEIFNKVKN